MHQLSSYDGEQKTREEDEYMDHPSLGGEVSFRAVPRRLKPALTSTVFSLRYDMFEERKECYTRTLVVAGGYKFKRYGLRVLATKIHKTHKDLLAAVKYAAFKQFKAEAYQCNSDEGFFAALYKLCRISYLMRAIVFAESPEITVTDSLVSSYLSRLSDERNHPDDNVLKEARGGIAAIEEFSSDHPDASSLSQMELNFVMSLVLRYFPELRPSPVYGAQEFNPTALKFGTACLFLGSRVSCERHAYAAHEPGTLEEAIIKSLLKRHVVKQFGSRIVVPGAGADSASQHPSTKYIAGIVRYAQGSHTWSNQDKPGYFCVKVSSGFFSKAGKHAMGKSGDEVAITASSHSSSSESKP